MKDVKDYENGLFFSVEHLGDWSSQQSQSLRDKAPFVFVEGYSKKKGKSAIIKYGKKNDHPQYLKDLVGKSGLHKTLIETKATLAMGDDIMFTVEEGDSVSEAQDAYNFLDEKGLIEMREGLFLDIGTYGGFTIQTVYSDDVTSMSNGIRVLEQAYKHDFDEFRLMKPFKNKYGIHEPEYGALHPHWGARFKPKDTIVLPLWFPELDKNGEETYRSKEFKLNEEIMGIGEDEELSDYQNRFLYYDRVYSNIAKYYPIPDYQSSATLDAIVLDGELIHFDVKEIENGLSIGYIITIFRKDWSVDDPEKEERLREAERKLVKGKMTGANNKGKVTIMRAQPSPDGKNQGNVNIQPIPNNNNPDRHLILEKRKNIYILVGHGIIAPEIGGVPDLTKGGFSSEADKIVDAIANLFFTRLNKWRKVMAKFYIAIAKEAGFKVKGLKFVDNIPFRKKIEGEILKYAYTIDEIREMNGASPLTDENREVLHNESQGIISTNGTQTQMEF